MIRLGRLVGFVAGVSIVCVMLIWAQDIAALDSLYSFATVAGQAEIPGSTDGTGNKASFNYPQAITVDASGNVYVADTDNHTIRKLALVGTNWVVSTIAGLAGNRGSADGMGSTARFCYPTGITVGRGGILYVADELNHIIRKLTPEGHNWEVSTIAGLAGNRGSADGTNNTSRFNYPEGVAVDSANNVYVTDQANHTIRKITPVNGNWVTTTIAGQVGILGSADGIGSNAQFYNPEGVTVDGAGSVYVTDYYNYTIRKVTPVGGNWVVSTIAGLARSAGNADGTNSTARFLYSMGIAVDNVSAVYVADTGNHTIRKLKQIGSNWVTSTIGGSAGSSGSADGTSSVARFHWPYGVAVNADGVIYVADSQNNTVRKGALLNPPWLQWQLEYFGSTNCTQAASTADPDGDGQNNLEEFLTGTDPTNSASAFRIVGINQQGNDLCITWRTVGGRTNSLQTAPGNRDSGYETNFIDISGWIILPGTGGMTTNYVDVGGATNGPARYYRIQLVE